MLVYPYPHGVKLPNFYVYEYYDPRNATVFYVGMGQDNRWRMHLYPSKLKDNSPKSKKILEIQAESKNPEIKILESGMTQEDAFALEIKMIAFYGKENLTNRTSGGQGHVGSKSFLGKKHKPETIEKLRQSKIGSKNPMFGMKRTEIAKKLTSEANSGENHPNFGRHLEKSTTAKISSTLSGRKLSAEVCKNHGLATKKRWDAWRNGVGPRPNAPNPNR